MRTILGVIETGGPGGAETVFLEQLRRLDPTRWRGVAVVPYKGWLYERLRECGITTYVLAERHAFDPLFLLALVRLVRRHRVSVMHGHLFGSSVRVALVSLLTRVPAVGTLHGVGDLAANERFLDLKVGLLRRGLRRIVAVSEPLRKAVLARIRLAEHQVTVIPNGIDASRFAGSRDDSIRASLGIGADVFVVGSVGNLNAAKGFDVLLRAAALLRAGHPGLRVVVVGDATGRRSAELLALRTRLGLDDTVVFAGFRSDVPAALASFDVYALTSHSEGFSLSLVEAMAAGLPVVATRCGGPEDILTDEVTGLLVENGSHEAVAAAIERLLHSPQLRASLGAAARQSVQSRFTLDAQSEAYDRLYHACLTHEAGVRDGAGYERLGELRP